MAAALEGITLLRPWMAAPDRRLLSLAPTRFWRDQNALPLRLDDQGLLIATAGELDDQARQRLSAAAAQPVQLTTAAGSDVRFWLDVLTGECTWAAAMLCGVGQLLEELGLHTFTGKPLQEGPSDILDVEQVATAFGFTEEMALERLALQAHLPHLRLGKYRLPVYLAELLPRALAEQQRVVPVAARHGAVILASPQVAAWSVGESLRAALGAEPQRVLCAPTAFDAAFSALYGGEAGQRRPARPLEDEEVLRHLRANGAIDAARLSALLHVAAATGESAVARGQRLGVVRDEHVRAARASAFGVASLNPARVQPDPALAACAGAALWREWRCVPVGWSGRDVILACDAPPSTGRAALIGSLLGAAGVEPRLLLPVELDALLHNLPERRATCYTAEEHLVASGLVPAEAVADARTRTGRDGLGIADALLQAGAIDGEDVVEAHALERGCPWIRLEHYAPRADVSSLLPQALAQTEQALALRCDGQRLTVVLLDRTGAAPSSALAAGTGMVIDPVLAATDHPQQALDRWYAEAGALDAAAAIPAAYQDFGQLLLRRGLLTRLQLERVWVAVARLGKSLDTALTERGLLTPPQLMAAFCEHLGIAESTLDLTKQRAEVVTALGERRTEVVWHDPVDHQVARLLPAAAAKQHGALPVRRQGDAIEVAFANPLERAAIDAVEAVLQHPIQLTTAPRRVIEMALHRVYGSKSIGERLLELGALTEDRLRRALRVQEETGVRLGQALVNLGFVTEEELAAIIAEQAGHPFFDLRSAHPDEAAARLLPRELERAQGVLPLFDDGVVLVVACTEVPPSETVADLARMVARPVQPVIVTESAFDDSLNAVYRDEYLDHAAGHLLYRSPDDSASRVLSRGQQISLVIALALLGLALLLAPIVTVTVLIALSTLFYVAFSAYKFYLAYRAIAHTLEIETAAEEVAALDDRELPLYTILVPVYRETEVFPILVGAIERLDYPKAKLDVKILLEEDDKETIEVARRSNLPSHFKLVVVPHGQPKGKPKACNYGLIHAQGEYVVIYDAEDIPEPDQLKKAIVAFAKGDERIACVQAKLNYFNRDQNLLTRWFTTEYSMWFDLFLPGLDATGAPIPLGGTSNHFKMTRLRELGAWDPYNVTEDADLGMRLHKAGWKTAVIDSTTYEEANSEVYNWIRQRSRWVKGYVQTYLVHMRHPVRLYRAIGPKAFLSFQFVVGGTFFGFLVNPLYWILTALWFTTRWRLIEQVFPLPIFFIGSIGLYFGNFAFTYVNVLGCLKRQYYDMVRYALLTPIYWALMSVAAWKGFLQLFYAPNYWEKTNHGLYQAQPPIGTAVPTTASAQRALQPAGGQA